MTAPETNSSELRPGATAPDFAVPDDSGAVRSLGERVRDRPHVVIFYRGCW